MTADRNSNDDSSRKQRDAYESESEHECARPHGNRRGREIGRWSSHWHWYLLLGYPVASLLAVVALGRLTAGSSVLASSLGSVALVVLVTAMGVLSLPALWRDVELLDEATDEWQPERETYVGAAVLPPLLIAVLGGLAAGFGVAVALVVVTFVASTIAVSVVYLYNRHRTVGLSTRR